MPILSPELLNTIENHTTNEDNIQHQLYRETHLTRVYPQMISGPVQGKFLEMISHMIQPKNILEVGTFTGYSTISLAKGLKKRR